MIPQTSLNFLPVIEKKLREKVLGKWKTSATQIEEKSFELSKTDKRFGDFSSNLPMQLTKILKNSPLTIGEEIKFLWDTSTEKDIEKIEILPPGFINFTLSSDLKSRWITNLYKNPLNALDTTPSKKICLEFVSANPTGPLHIGHGRWAVVGSILANVLTFAGHQVDKEFYINDTGVQIEKLNESVQARRENRDVPEGGYQGDYIKELIRESDPKSMILEEQKLVLNRFKTQFDRFVSESSIRENQGVEKTIQKLSEKNITYKKGGATWFQSTDYGDDKDRVLIKSDGSYTYFATDIAYHYHKINRHYPLLLNILGADHHGYTKRITSIVEILSEKKTKLEVLVGQLVSLTRNGKPVKFSKRAGNIIELKEVMDEIGVDALRYFLSMRSMQSHLEFDLDLAKKKNLENPVFYVQYAYARICSILKKAQTHGLTPINPQQFDFNIIKNSTTNELFKRMIEFEKEIQMITQTFQIHHLNTYLYDLSTLFHRLYNEKIFVDKNTPSTRNKSKNYLFFLIALQKIIKKCFDLLGITAVENM